MNVLYKVKTYIVRNGFNMQELENIHNLIVGEIREKLFIASSRTESYSDISFHPGTIDQFNEVNMSRWYEDIYQYVL